MAGTKLVTAAILLLLSWSSNAQLDVVISVSYTTPPGFTPGPNEYRAALGPVDVTCTATGGAGIGNYHYVWTSTCSSCDFQTTSTGATSVINRQAIHSGDTGNHTCTATRGGESASDSIVFNVVGAGIYVVNGVNGTTGTQPNNGLVVSNETASGRRIRFLCRSDSLTRNVGTLIGLDGNAFTGNDFLGFQSPSNGGELDIVGSEDLPLPASEQGIYTCQIPLQSGEMAMVNIGIYGIGFNTGPTINEPPVFTLGSSYTVTCTSTGSPATNVTFARNGAAVGPLRDGETVAVGGITYQLSQILTNRQESIYENVLTFSDELSNIAGDTFACTVANTLGSGTSQSVTIRAIAISSSPQTVIVGDTVTYTCTSVLGPATIEWQDVDNGNMVLEMASGVMELVLVLDRVSQSMNGRRYRCRVMMDTGTIVDTVTLTIEDPSVTATIDVSGSRVIGESVILTCNVAGLTSLAGDTAIEFSGPRGVMGTGISLQLTLNPAEISDAGQYTCVATVTSSLLNSDVEDTDTEDLRLLIPDPSVSVTHNGGTPLYAGIVLTLTCEITVTGVPTAMLSNVTVSTTWTGAAGNTLSTGGRITITPTELNSGTSTFISAVVFDTLVTGNGGTYTCQANINPPGSLTHIDASNGVDADITLDIQISTLEVSAVSSTTRLPDVPPYNTFSITCTATAPEGVVASKTFTWRRAVSAGGSCDDFAVVGGNMDSDLEQPVSTSVLNVTVTEADIGTLRFCCQANISNPAVSGNDVTFITVVGPAPPMQPTDLRVTSPGATTATVEWTVPLIAYTPETYTYVVNYSTDNLKCQVLMSDPVESGADFDAVNQSFSVELTGLEPNTTYNYQVMSENTEDTAVSVLQSFATIAGTNPEACISSDTKYNVATIVGGVLGVLVALLLAYGVVTTIVIVVMHRNHRGRVSINQHTYDGMEEPVKWSAMTKLGDPDIKTSECEAYGQAHTDIKTSECVAYGQVQPPSTDGAQDTTNEPRATTYEVLDQ